MWCVACVCVPLFDVLLWPFFLLLLLKWLLSVFSLTLSQTHFLIWFQGLEVWGLVVVVAVEIWIQTIYYLGLCRNFRWSLLKHQTPGTQKKKSPFLSLGTWWRGFLSAHKPQTLEVMLVSICRNGWVFIRIMMTTPNLPWISQGCFLPPGHCPSCHFPTSKKFISSSFHLSLWDSDSESLSLVLLWTTAVPNSFPLIYQSDPKTRLLWWESFSDAQRPA